MQSILSLVVLVPFSSSIRATATAEIQNDVTISTFRSASESLRVLARINLTLRIAALRPTCQTLFKIEMVSHIPYFDHSHIH
jgi:hypothetical protein